MPSTIIVHNEHSATGNLYQQYDLQLVAFNANIRAAHRPLITKALTEQHG